MKIHLKKLLLPKTVSLALWLSLMNLLSSATADDYIQPMAQSLEKNTKSGPGIGMKTRELKWKEFNKQAFQFAKAKIPIRHVISLNDQVVPPEENTLEAQRRLNALQWDLELVTIKEGNACRGHQFPLTTVEESTRFIMKHAMPKTGL